MTQTFSMWFGDFVADFYKGKFAGQRLGQAFFNELYALSPLLGGALTTFRNDPYYSDEVSADVLAFVERNWSFTTLDNDR